MNPLTNVRNIQNLNKRELELGIPLQHSWHQQYKDSAWIFIGGLDYDLTEGDIICVFSQYGEVVNINLVRDKKTGKSKGFAFLCFEDQHSTILSVDNLNSIRLCGRTIRVDHVEEYRVPKMREDMDPEQQRLALEGCAPPVVREEERGAEDTGRGDDSDHKKDRKRKQEEEEEAQVEAPQCVDGVMLPPRLFGVKKEPELDLRDSSLKKKKKSKKSKKSKAKKSKKITKHRSQSADSSDGSSDAGSDSDLYSKSKTKHKNKTDHWDKSKTSSEGVASNYTTCVAKDSSYNDVKVKREHDDDGYQAPGSGSAGVRVKSEPRSDAEGNRYPNSERQYNKDYRDGRYNKDDRDGRYNKDDRDGRYNKDDRDGRVGKRSRYSIEQDVGHMPSSSRYDYDDRRDRRDYNSYGDRGRRY